MVKAKLGYSTGIFTPDRLSFKERVKAIYKIQRDAIELGFVRAERLQENIDGPTFSLVKKFSYRSVHAPSVDIHYPSRQADSIFPRLREVIQRAEVHTLVFHPDAVGDFSWLVRAFADLNVKLAFENMDKMKSFGKSVEDLQQVFTKVSEGRWVFDVNHLCTNNKTMSDVRMYHQQFGDRLCHYHLSAFRGFHSCFLLNEKGEEDVIITGIRNLSVPIIHEGGAEGMRNLLPREHECVLNRLKNYVKK